MDNENYNFKKIVYVERWSNNVIHNNSVTVIRALLKCNWDKLLLDFSNTFSKNIMMTKCNCLTIKSTLHLLYSLVNSMTLLHILIIYNIKNYIFEDL